MPSRSCPRLTRRRGAANLQQVGSRRAARQCAHAGHERGTFGSGDNAARIHQVEEMRALKAVVVGRQQRITNAPLPFHPLESIQKFLSLLLVQLKFGADRRSVATIKTIFRKLLLFHQANIPVSLVRGPAQIVHVLDALKKRANALEAVSEFDGDGVEIDPPALLEVGELGNLQSVEQNLPADAPSAEGRRLPVVLLKPDIVFLEVDADGAQALEIDVLHIDR